MMPRHRRVAGLLCLGSAVFGLMTDTLGLELYEFGVPHGVAITLALLHLYCGLGLWAGATLLGVVAARAGYPATFVTAAVGAGAALLVLVCSPALRRAEAWAEICTVPRLGEEAPVLSPPP